MNFREHLKENLKLAYPVMLTNLGHVLMGVTDNVMVGHINAVSLAAAGLALVVFNVFLLFGIGVSYAITPLVASAHGANNKHEVIETVRHGLIINVVNAILLIIIVSIGRNILYHIGQPKEVIDRAFPFLSIITWSLIPVMMFQTFKQFAEGLSITRLAMVIMFSANVVNILLNYAFVYGHFGCPALGLEGSGWATLLSRLFMAVAIITYIFYSKSFSIYRNVFTIGKYNRKTTTTLLAIGIPSGGQFIFEVAAFDFSLVMMGWLGTTAQAAHQVAINMATISYMTTAGLAAAATIRVGFFKGRNDVKNLQRAAYSTLSTAMVMMSIWAIIFIAGRRYLPSLYVDDPNVIETASLLLIMAGVFQLSDGAQVVCASALRGLQDVKIPSVFVFFSYWIIGLPLGYFLSFNMGVGPMGIWWGLFIGLTLTATAMFIRLRSLVQG